MKWFLYAISLVWIAFGAWAILYTTETRNFAKSLVKEIDRKVLSILPATAGLLFLFAATASRHSWFIRLIGIVAIIKGVLMFVTPKDLYDDLTNWYLRSVSDQTYRLHGILALILGTVVLSWIF